MNGEWCYFKSHFDSDTCEKILRDVQSIPVGAGVIADNRLDSSFRRSNVRFIQSDNPTFQHVFDALWKMAIQANNQFFNVHITKLDFIQVAEYSADYQGEYKEHHDVFWVNGDPVYHRKLSAVVQLTNPTTYEGGDLVLTETPEHPNVDDIRQQGSAIFFPSFFRHQAKPVTQGTRYSIAAWFEGPKWR